jgi:2-polyprenyl-3-methyl-5-hydroxy-6-metoxy-1,4-benzoquinol methylase
MTFHERKGMWANGAAYEYYVGRWSRLVALQFLKSLEIPSDSKWLDVGCGTGILSQTILDIASPYSVVGVDTSEDISSLPANRSTISILLFTLETHNHYLLSQPHTIQ